MGRNTHTSITRIIADKTLVVDNGAFTIKAGYVPDESDGNPEVWCNEFCQAIPNCIARSRQKVVYVASQLSGCRDFGEMIFRRPMENGYIVNWKDQRNIWEQIFFDCNAILPCDPHQTNLLLTEPLNCPQALLMNCDQMVFEEFEFASYTRVPTPVLCAYNEHWQTFKPGHSLMSFNSTTFDTTKVPEADDYLLVVDMGYSSTTVTPLVKGRPLYSAQRRLDVGGKLLTNHMKNVLTIRNLSMTNETHLVNSIKEALCYVAPNREAFSADLENSWSREKQGGTGLPRNPAYLVNVVLPDYDTRHSIMVRSNDSSSSSSMNRIHEPSGVSMSVGPPEYSLLIGNERFCVPEVIFSPMDIDLHQAGLAELIISQILAPLPEYLQIAFISNILVVGGTANTTGMTERLYNELRENSPIEWPVRVGRAPDPVKWAWLGACKFAYGHPHQFTNTLVTRQEYQEYGANWAFRHISTLYVSFGQN